MLTHKKEVEAILASTKNDERAVSLLSAVLKNYVLLSGISHLRAQMRAAKRRELLAEVEPKFVKGKTTGSFEFSPATKLRLKERAAKFFDVYPLTAKLMLGDAKRADLETRIDAELKSGKGHEARAAFYRVLAEPLKGDKRVRDVWSAEDVLKRHDELKRRLALATTRDAA